MRKKKFKHEDDFNYEDLLADPEIESVEQDDEDEPYSPIDPEDDTYDSNDDDEDDNEEEVNIKPKKTSIDKKKFYVDPKEFDTEIMNYYDTGVMSNNLAEMVSKISHKLSFASNFINYSYREEMAGDGIIRMMKALIAKKYNKDKGTNPFSYFTRIAFNAFRNRIKKEKHIHETHEKYKEELELLSSNYNNIVKNKNMSASKKYN
jgi:hypothetical protein